MHSPGDSSVQFIRLHEAFQLLVTPRRISGGEPAEGDGDECIQEDKGGPHGEEEERGEPDHPNGRVEDGEDLWNGEGNAPEEHGLGKTEKERQILETVGLVSAFGKVRVLWGE